MGTHNNDDLDIDRGAEAHGYENAQPEVTVDVDQFVWNFNTGLQLLVAKVQEDAVDPLRVFASLNGVSKSIKDAAPTLEKYAMLEADKYGKAFDKDGVRFELRNGYAQLDYEKDEVYADLKRQLKEREAILKIAHSSKDTYFDSEGVEVPKVPVKSYTKDSLTVKFTKR